MANFKTHINVAAIASVAAATLCLGMGAAQPRHIAMLTLLGTVGGILPDIDLDHAAPTKIMFTVLALLAVFLVLTGKAAYYSLIELWLAAILVYTAVRYPLFQWFNHYTQHRGIFHSLVAALMFWFFVTATAFHVFDLDASTAWLAGFFVFFGYIIHLCLDEFFSVDFMNKRVKRSFGSALKLLDWKNRRISMLMAGTAFILFFISPPADEFQNGFFSIQAWENLHGHLLPKGRWFMQQ